MTVGFNLPILSAEETVDFNVLISEFSDGSEERRLANDQPVIGWKLTSPTLTKTEYAAYRSALVGKYGSLSSFTWENVFDGVVYTVRFVAGSFRGTGAGVKFKAEFAFQKVIS